MISYEEYRDQTLKYNTYPDLTKPCILCSEGHINKFLCATCWLKFRPTIQHSMIDAQLTRVLYDIALEKLADKEIHKLLSGEGDGSL